MGSFSNLGQIHPPPCLQLCQASPRNFPGDTVRKSGSRGKFDRTELLSGIDAGLPLESPAGGPRVQRRGILPGSQLCKKMLLGGRGQRL